MGNSSLAIEHYIGPNNKLPTTATVQESIQERVSRAQRKDAAWLCQLRSSPLPLVWSAYNVVQDRQNDGVYKMRTISAFGPLPDSPLAHPDTMLSTITYLDTSLKQLGMSYSHIIEKQAQQAKAERTPVYFQCRK